MAVPTLTYKTAIVDGSTVGNNTIVDADTNNKINVHGYVLFCGTSGEARWEDGANGTALTGRMDADDSAAIVAPFSEIPWFSTSVNTLLNLEVTKASSSWQGHIIYSLTT